MLYNRISKEKFLLFFREVRCLTPLSVMRWAWCACGRAEHKQLRAASCPRLSVDIENGCDVWRGYGRIEQQETVGLGRTLSSVFGFERRGSKPHTH